MNKLSGKTTIITGAGSGIGKAIAIAFAQEGSNLILASRNTERLNNTRDQIKKSGGNAIVVPTDVSKESDVINLFKTSTQEFDKIDILINNSGVMEGGSLENLSLKTWNNVINVNLTGVFLCSREAFKIMKSQGNGRIINIGSNSAQMPRINSLPYSTSKHGIVGLTKCIALEGRDYNISASTLHPGNVRTETRFERDKKNNMDLEPMMSTEEFAEIAVTVASLPPHMTMLESIVLPINQKYVGRG